MKLKNILISQPEPEDLEKSPYKNLIQKHKVNLTFYKFFEVQGISVSEFRKTRIHLTDHTAVIFNSKNSVDHFFRMAKELREVIPESMKYFCTTESIALYLQNYIQYRKRKVFPGNQTFGELIDIMTKHRDEKFIFPCSDEKQTEYTKLLDKSKFKYTKAPMYRSVPRDLKHLSLKDYDIICLFSPIGVRSLLQNFPKAKEEVILVAAFGPATNKALSAAGIKATVIAPTKESPSMAMAVENFIMGKDSGPMIDQKPKILKSKTSLRKSTTSSSSTSSDTPATTPQRKATKSVFTSKAKYKQLMEQKKAKAAERRQIRAAEKARKLAESEGLSPEEVTKRMEAAKQAAATTTRATKTAAEKTAKTTVTKAEPKAKTATKTTAVKKTTTRTRATKKEE